MARARGFPGIENALFYLDNTRMLYGDAQKAGAELIQAIKAVGDGGSARFGYEEKVVLEETRRASTGAVGSCDHGVRVYVNTARG